MPARQRTWSGATVALLLSLSTTVLAADPADVDRLTQEQKAVNDAARAAQQRIDSLDAQTREMLAEYRSVTAELDRRRSYNERLQRQVDAQRANVTDIEAQLEAIQVTEREIVPFMERMIERLEQFIRLDLPFQRELRLGRVADLRSLMNQPDATNARRYRAILDAYQKEVEYGRTIGTYRTEIEVGGEARTVELFRLGRLLLAYQTLDRQRYGYWDPEQQGWTALPGQFHDAVDRGIRIAKEQMAPEMLILPIAAPKEH